ncbi:MAG: SHOCT domain-containing protein [Planctomycetota bacterium]
MPDAYVGKRVRCPACKHAQRVPEAKKAPVSDPMMDSFAALEAGEPSVNVRRLREILIGCGACQKTIRLSTRLMGKNAPCPTCGAMLKVDQFNLSKAKGDLVDMSHLELDTADLLLDDTSSHGSTLGGSSIQLEGTGTGYSMNDTSMGSTMGGSGVGGGAATDSQSQMRELKALNELKHSGAISADEYKRRKSEIYSGRSLAIQAMSRSADGSAGTRRAPAGYHGSVLPGPVKMLIVVAVLGVGGFVLWTTVLKGMLEDAQDTGGSVASTQPATLPDETAEDDPAPGSEGSMFAEVPDETEPTNLPDEAETALEDAAVLPEDNTVDAAVSLDEPVPMPMPDDTVEIAGVDTGLGGGEDVAEIEAAPEPPQEFMVTDWMVGWPDHAPPRNMAIAKACERIKQISSNGKTAAIGVAVGPPAVDLEDPDYERFRLEMKEVMTTAAMVDGVFEQMKIREYNKALKIGPQDLKCHRMLFTFTGRGNSHVTILTGVQEGRTVAYWFVGSGKVYSRFLDTVGRAELGPKS